MNTVVLGETANIFLQAYNWNKISRKMLNIYNIRNKQTVTSQYFSLNYKNGEQGQKIIHVLYRLCPDGQWLQPSTNKTWLYIDKVDKYGKVY